MRSKIIGILDIILGGVIAVGTRTFLHVCGGGMKTESSMGGEMDHGMGEMKMACSGVPTASLIVGIILAVIGILLIVVGSKKFVSIVLGILNAIAGIIVIGIPTFIVGVCSGAHMHCHMVTRPALIIIGSITMFVGTIGVLYEALKNRDSDISESKEYESVGYKSIGYNSGEYR